MAFPQINNVRIAGISAGVPSSVVDNAQLVGELATYDIDAFVANTGVRYKHFSKVLTTSDLCHAAAERFIADLGWDRKEIEALIFVSQNPDYLRPATACILQDRLGLSKECMAYDIELGCSGWVYGMSAIASLMSTGGVKKALLMAGDAKEDHLDLLAGHAGTVTALEYKEGASSMYFYLGSDGSGWDAICIPDGGSRNPVSAKSLEEVDYEGRKLTRLNSFMKGMDVFSFGISTAPKAVKKLAEHFNLDYSKADFLVLHQANLSMNAMIAKKLKFESTKVPSCMHDYGNISSASIPMVIVTQLKDKIQNGTSRLICCGFGVGLSWGSLAVETDNPVISSLVEVDDDQLDLKYIFSI